MNCLNKTLLVLLRLAIGWHFLVEGYEKIHSHDVGVTETSKPWSSEGYLREATGPMANYFHNQAGDLDELLLARITVVPLQEGQDPSLTPLHTRFPPALDKEWNDYFNRFTTHYQLSDDKDKIVMELARKKLDQSKEQTVRWLLAGKKSVKKSAPSSPEVTVEETIDLRIAEYKAKLQAIRDDLSNRLPAFGHDVEKQKLRAKKTEVAKLRAELTNELNEETERMKLSLADVLTKEQKAQGAVPEAEKVAWSFHPAFTDNPRWHWLQFDVPTDRVGKIDLATRVMLVVVGACLLLGLFTRTSCVVGAGFLLMIYLTMPPFPWLPENPRAEGHYLFVNKNLIEMLALLVLATSYSGRWAGLDGLLHALWQACPCRRRPTETSAPLLPLGTTNPHQPNLLESSHGH